MNSSSGDGFAAGPNGSTLWGKCGAAGLLLLADGHVLMQHRAAWTMQGGTWALPGGARDVHETAAQAAVREAEEETGITADLVNVVKEVLTAGPFPADPKRPELPGGWTYTTVIATAPRRLDTVANNESEDLEWVAIDEVENLNLMPAFAASWPELKKLIANATFLQ